MGKLGGQRAGRSLLQRRPRCSLHGAARAATAQRRAPLASPALVPTPSPASTRTAPTHLARQAPRAQQRSAPARTPPLPLPLPPSPASPSVNRTLRDRRPGRSSAPSSTSGRLVAASSSTPGRPSKPSSSANKRDRVMVVGRSVQVGQRRLKRSSSTSEPSSSAAAGEGEQKPGSETCPAYRAPSHALPHAPMPHP